MDRARLGVVVVSALLGLAGTHCASSLGSQDFDAESDEDGGASTRHDSKPQDRGLQSDGSNLAHDGQAQADTHTQTDTGAQADTHAQTDTHTQTDTEPPATGCEVQNAGVCDPVCQNCAGANRCTADRANAANLTTCIPAGTVGPNGACTTDATRGDTCAEGLICMSDAKCKLFCRTNADCDEVNGLCSVDINGYPGLKVCLPDANCDPVAKSGCGSTLDCYFVKEDITACVTAGAGGDGAACDAINSCKPGFVCATGAANACRRMCDANHPCANGAYVCHPITGSTDGYGACAPP
jgi:hypothetical protein